MIALAAGLALPVPRVMSPKPPIRLVGTLSAVYAPKAPQYQGMVFILYLGSQDRSETNVVTSDPRIEQVLMAGFNNSKHVEVMVDELPGPPQGTVQFANTAGWYVAVGARIGYGDQDVGGFVGR